MWWPVFPCDTWYQSQQNTIRLSDSLHILDKNHNPYLFCARVVRIFAAKPSLWQKWESTNFCPRFLETFCNNFSRDSGEWRIFAKPKVVQNSFLIPFDESHAFQIWMFSKYFFGSSIKVEFGWWVKRQLWVICKTFVLQTCRYYQNDKNESTWHWSHVCWWARVLRAYVPYSHCSEHICTWLYHTATALYWNCFTMHSFMLQSSTAKLRSVELRILLRGF